MRQLQTKLPVVGEENQTFALVVEPANRVKVVPLFGQQVADRAALRPVVPRTNVTTWLVDGDVEFAPGFDRHAVNGDAVAGRVDLRSQHLDDVPVDLDPPGQDDLFTGAPRGHARIGEKFL